MKDIVISKARSRTELITLSACFIIACLFNLGAIIYYKSPAIELITSLAYVLNFFNEWHPTLGEILSTAFFVADTFLQQLMLEQLPVKLVE